jgi:hypothetical protein
MAKPNLALIPATIGDKVYSILPSDGVGDFDFDRGTIATRINAQGLIEQVASGENRLNYSLLDGEVVGCPHLLLEDEATNLVQYSEDFSNAAWTKSNSSITSNSVISPDGTLNADKLVVSTSSGYISGTFISSGNTDVTVSFFVKSDTLSNFNFTEAFYFGTITNFDLSNGTTDNGKIENYGNGWYRCSKTYTYASGQQIVAIQIKTGATGSLYIFGGQYEEGSYPTSYIKSNSGSATTRAAETCDGSGNAATFNDSEGVLMAEIAALADDGAFRVISLDGGDNTNIVKFGYRTTSNAIYYEVRSGDVSQAFQIYTTTDVKEFHKVAVLYQQNNFKLFINGVNVLSDTSGVTPVGLNNLSFGIGASANFYGKTKQIQYFDSILDSEQLEQLTSWDSFRAMAEGQLYTIE